MGCQNHNGISMFLSLCQMMIPGGGKKVSELVCFVIDSKAEKPSKPETSGASLRDIASAGVCPSMHSQPAPLPQTIASVL